MLGDSYYGFTQWAAAASGHPALAAIAPRVTSADLGIWLADGTFPLEVAASWSLETWVDEALYEYEGALDWSVRPQSEIVPGHLGGARTVGLDDWARGLVSDQARLPVPGRVPALHLGGFNDFLLPGQLATWERSRKGPGADWSSTPATTAGPGDVGPTSPTRTPSCPAPECAPSSTTTSARSSPSSTTTSAALAPSRSRRCAGVSRTSGTRQRRGRRRD